MAASGTGSADRLGVTLLFSLIAHGVLALGLTFEYEKPAPQLPSIDVILVQSANDEKPEKADFLAQANNAGGGTVDKAQRPSEPLSSAIPKAVSGIAPVQLENGAPRPETPTDAEILTMTKSKFTVRTDTAKPDTPTRPAAVEREEDSANSRWPSSRRRSSANPSNTPSARSGSTSAPTRRSTSSPRTCARGSR